MNEMSSAVPAPEGDIVKRPLQFFWLVDYSGSMGGRKIATLNQAIREAIPEVKKAVATHPEVQIVMRAIKFSDDALWHVGPDAVPLDQFVWPELTIAGGTSTAKAIRKLTDELSIEKMSKKGYPPVCILVSDGFCTDPSEEYNAAIQELEQQPWGKKAVRLSIAIGNESDYDESELLKFVSHKEQVGVLKADTPERLATYIKWASVTASIGASAGKSKGGSAIEDSTNVVMAAPPPPAAPPVTAPVVEPPKPPKSPAPLSAKTATPAAPSQGPPPPAPRFVRYVQPPPRRRGGLLGALGVGTLPPPEPQPLNAKVAVTPAPSGGWMCTNPADNAPMIWIPAGRLEGKTQVQGFWMYQYEVTNEQYHKFVEANPDWKPGGRKAKQLADQDYLNHWRGEDKEFASTEPRAPVAWVSWHAAMAYSNWVGGDLPTNDQWEWAARGGVTGKKFVWGDQWPPPEGAGNFCDQTAKRKFGWTAIDGYDDGYAGTSPVGSFTANGYGLYDMAGNVSEWVKDAYFDSRNLRGGSSYVIGPGALAVSTRDSYYPPLCSGNYGFRCARTP